jgi:two-component system OmpR family response regulator
MRILLIEDDLTIATFILRGLKEAGYAVDHASDGETGFHLLCNEPYDAAVVDIMLPKMNGLVLVSQARNESVNTPVIFLSARREVDDRVRGLQSGADDYLVKPFAFSELLARLQALIRRAGGTTETTRLTVGDLEMDLLKHRVWRESRLIDIQPREFSLLEYLMRNAGRVVSKTMIMEHVWNYDFDPQTNVVEACVCRLRTKLNEGFETEIIRTVRGVGYVLEHSA